MSKRVDAENSHWPERYRRSAISETYHSLHEPVVQERAMQLAESLMRHELAHKTKKFVFLKRTNFMKFLLMVISIVSYLIVLHADIQAEGNKAFISQLGVSTALIPSIYRVSSMFLRLNLSSPILDILIVVVILAHQLMAAIILLQVMFYSRQCLKWMLSLTVALLFVGVGVCVAEIGSAILSTQLQRRSSSWASTGEGQGGPEQNSIGLMVFFLHAGELHVLSSLSTSEAGMFYTTSTSLLPIYLVARASSAIWGRPWIASLLDAVMNFFCAFIYACAAVALSWSLEGAEHFYEKHIDPSQIPMQRTKLYQPAAWIRFVLAISLSALLLLEGLAALLHWPYKILRNIFKLITNKKS